MNIELHEALNKFQTTSENRNTFGDSFRNRHAPSFVNSSLLDRDVDPNFVTKTRTRKSLFGLASPIVSKLATVAVESLGQ